MKTLLMISLVILSSCASTTFSLQGSSMQDKGSLSYCDGYPHGSVIYGYLSTTAPCSEASRTCINGSWSGPQIYSTCK